MATMLLLVLLLWAIWDEARRDESNVNWWTVATLGVVAVWLVTA